MKNKLCFLFALILTIYGSLFSQSWRRLNGPIGTDIYAAVITRDKGEIYCFASGNKLFHSTNFGTSWTELSLASILGSIQYVTNIRESPTGDIFLSTNNRLYKLNKTTNNWYMFPHVFTAYNFDFSPTGNRIYVASRDGLYISSDGLKFTKFQSWSVSSVEILCLGNDNNFVRQVIGTDANIWRFADSNGKFLATSNSQCCRTLFFHKKSNTLIDYENQVFMTSKDYGKTWTKINLSNNISFRRLIELSDGTIIGVGSQVYESKDNGLTWQISSEFSYQNTSTYINNYSLTKSDKDELLLFENNATHLLRRNASFEVLEVPVEATRIYSKKQFGDKNIYCATSTYAQVSFDDGITWNKILDREISSVLLWKNGSVGYMLKNDLVLSNDKLKTYVKKTLPVVTFGRLLLDNNENIILIGVDKVYTSKDKGNSWQSLGQNLTNPLTSIVEEININSQNVIYIKTYPLEEYYYSLDLGLSWTKITSASVKDSRKLYLTKNNTFLWEAYSNNTYVIRYSTDFFKTFNDVVPDKTDYLLNIDDYANLIFYNNNNSVTVRNIFNNQKIIIPLTGLPVKDWETFKIIRGDNNALYASYYGNPIFKYDQILPTDECTIQGNVFIDEDLDCIRSLTENKTIAFQLEAFGGGFRYFTTVSSNGDYKFIVGPGSYSMNLIGYSPVWKECNFPKNINIQAQQIINQNNLLVQLTEQCADINTSLILSRLRRCFNNNKAFVHISNDGTIPSRNSNIYVQLDPLFENITSSENPISVNGNNFNFIIPEILPGEKHSIEFTFDVSCNSTLGQEHCFSSIVTNNEKCKTYVNPTTTSSICGKNFGSWDPNYKDAIVRGRSSESFESTDKKIEYVIHFQNTGTDTAFEISILDQLDSKLVWSSVKSIDASHPYSYSISPKGILEIKFSNIQLPDSNINEPKSHGYFKYSAQPSKNLEPGNVIHNIAEIYFDKNLSISTNDAFVRMSLSTQATNYVDDQLLYAAPVPAKEKVFIRLPNHFINDKLKINISNIESKSILNLDFCGETLVISRNELTSGIYFVTVENSKGESTYCKIFFE